MSTSLGRSRGYFSRAFGRKTPSRPTGARSKEIRLSGALRREQTVRRPDARSDSKLGPGHASSDSWRGVVNSRFPPGELGGDAFEMAGSAHLTVYPQRRGKLALGFVASG